MLHNRGKPTFSLLPPLFLHRDRLLLKPEAVLKVLASSSTSTTLPLSSLLLHLFLEHGSEIKTSSTLLELEASTPPPKGFWG